MKLLLKEQCKQLALNGQLIDKTGNDDLVPVVKLFTPDANCTWLLVSTEPDDADIAYGLCDLGLGCPEIGSVRLSEIATVRGVMGLPVERDIHFTGNMMLKEYAAKARVVGWIRN
ncbi:MAG: DUF2958 domain-containing protein [Alphaproteobacteria bacterium]|nr:DUF2958 domain-containing protein [Alphaproteobacteria bacterium]